MTWDAGPIPSTSTLRSTQDTSGLKFTMARLLASLTLLGRIELKGKLALANYGDIY